MNGNETFMMAIDGNGEAVGGCLYTLISKDSHLNGVYTNTKERERSVLVFFKRRTEEHMNETCLMSEILTAYPNIIINSLIRFWHISKLKKALILMRKRILSDTFFENLNVVHACFSTYLVFAWIIIF